MKKILTSLLLLLAYNSYSQINLCDESNFICSKKTLIENHLMKHKVKGIETRNATCIPQKDDVYGKWYKWIISTPGKLEFVITPLKQTSDIDFIVYKSLTPECGSMELIRCMASGMDYSMNIDANQKCLGMTGLSNKSEDYIESFGCSENQNNFLKGLECKKGEVYFLYVENVLDENGYELQFSGDAEFVDNIDQVNDNILLSNYKVTLENNQECNYSLKNKYPDIKVKSSISIYPNPVDDILLWKIEDKITNINSVNIYSMDGVEVIKPSKVENRINVKKLIPGIYLISFKTYDEVITKVFIKK